VVASAGGKSNANVLQYATAGKFNLDLDADFRDLFDVASHAAAEAAFYKEEGDENDTMDDLPPEVDFGDAAGAGSSSEPIEPN